eukprot:TRINITY_DN7261_c0_g1_i1.p1 TRINITY_DN7261_c0_g1~~TRINITY_DN7261_c0_g1_i1.p1  ORF type:complete len:276 (+),score=61.25 TRINITY_DN7261_c0_g1_i1:91-918(+)
MLSNADYRSVRSPQKQRTNNFKQLVGILEEELLDKTEELEVYKVQVALLKQQLAEKSVISIVLDGNPEEAAQQLRDLEFKHQATVSQLQNTHTQRVIEFQTQIQEINSEYETKLTAIRDELNQLKEENKKQENKIQNDFKKFEETGVMPPRLKAQFTKLENEKLELENRLRDMVILKKDREMLANQVKSLLNENLTLKQKSAESENECENLRVVLNQMKSNVEEFALQLHTKEGELAQKDRQLQFFQTVNNSNENEKGDRKTKRMSVFGKKPDQS